MSDEENPTITRSKPGPKPKEKTIKVRLKHLELGNGSVKFNTSGLHVDPDDRQYLPNRVSTDRRGIERPLIGKKIEPGYIYELPEDVALKYLKTSGRFLEQVYD